MKQSRQSRNEKILFDFYRRCYKAATPSADFDELVANAEVIQGRKHIKYNDYLLEEDVFNKIIEDIFKEYKISKYERKAFSFEFHLGCAPKIKMNERT